MKFVFDLDGTICFKGQPISNKILAALSAIKEQGHDVIFASARPIRDILPILHEDFHHYPMIGGNGSLISQDTKIIYSKAFTETDLEEIGKLIEEYEATYLIDSDWDYAYTGPDNHPILKNVDPAKLANLVELNSLESVVKILLLTSNNLEGLSNKVGSLDLFVNLHGNENIIDISPKGINKWSALRELGLKEGEYVAFGNDANDISMFEHALYTVMIGNHEQLSKFANEIIPLEGDYEGAIVKRLEELSKKYQSITN